MTDEIRFHCDECVPDAVAQGLARRRISVSTTETVELKGADDEAQLSHVQREGRVLVTQDSDFLRLAARPGDLNYPSTSRRPMSSATGALPGPFNPSA